jgi:hypothetical protein
MTNTEIARCQDLVELKKLADDLTSAVRATQKQTAKLKTFVGPAGEPLEWPAIQKLEECANRILPMMREASIGILAHCQEAKKRLDALKAPADDAHDTKEKVNV